MERLLSEQLMTPPLRTPPPVLHSAESESPARATGNAKRSGRRSGVSDTRQSACLSGAPCVAAHVRYALRKSWSAFRSLRSIGGLFAINHPDRRLLGTETIDNLLRFTRLRNDAIPRLEPVFQSGCACCYSALAERAPMDRNHSITFSWRVPRPSAASSAVPSA